MRDTDLPALFKAADRKAAEEQKRFLRLQKTELILLVAAAVLSEPSWSSQNLNILALLGVACLLGAILARVYAAFTHPERVWYDARAVAESTKTLAWQYAVGGEAFRIDDRRSKARFIDRLRALASRFEGLDIPAGGNSDAQITSAMEGLRQRDFAARRQVYRDNRVINQQQWYSQKANFNRTRARWWGRGLLGAEILATVLGLLRGLGTFDVDWAGIFAAAAAAILAWRQTKQHESLAEAYAVTSHDVAALAAKLDGVSEEDWPTLVHDSEAAFSREHTVWLARRQALRTE